MEATPLLERPVPGGPRAYRRHIRVLGAPAALLPSLVLAGMALVLLRGNDSTARGAAGFLAAILAAPCLLLAGMPLTTGTGAWVGGVGGSIVLWLWIGTIAARRATRNPAATWRDYWREFAWLAGGVWIGTVGAFVVADLVLGRPLL